MTNDEVLGALKKMGEDVGACESSGGVLRVYDRAGALLIEHVTATGPKYADANALREAVAAKEPRG